MPYTVVIPGSWNPSRQALNDILSAMIASFMTAVPGVIRRYWSELPASLTGEGPFVYQGPINENIVHDQGTRQTTYTGYIGYVDVLADPVETNTRCNAFADYMRELFTANARISLGAAGTGSVDAILQQTGITDGPSELTQGANTRLVDMHMEFQFVVLEGRN